MTPDDSRARVLHQHSLLIWRLAIKKVAMAKKFEKIENHIRKPPKIIAKTPKNRRRRLRRRPKGAALRAAPLGCCFQMCCMMSHITLAVSLLEFQ